MSWPRLYPLSASAKRRAHAGPAPADTEEDMTGEQGFENLSLKLVLDDETLKDAPTPVLVVDHAGNRILA
jgi:hypothetical protein